MVSIKATIRQKHGKQNQTLREKGVLPAVLYGEGIKNASIDVSEKDFDNVYAEAGESSLLSVELDGKKYDVLIHQIAKDPLTGKFLHVDFYKPSTKKKIEAEIPLVFEGESLAVKDLDGILVREVQVLHVKGLAHNLPREIVVDISGLKSFEDRIHVSQLNVPDGIDIMREPEDIVALVVPVAEEKEEQEIPAEEGAEVPSEEAAEGGSETEEPHSTEKDERS